MQITANSTVADIATHDPGSIRIFQQHQIDFCCGGRIPLAEACERRGLDANLVLAELRAAQDRVDEQTDWRGAALPDLVSHIQRRFHETLRAEIPRLSQMLAKVVSRHGASHPEVRQVQVTFETLRGELLDHMAKEDAVLFPAIVAIDGGDPAIDPAVSHWVQAPIQVMEAEHEAAGEALARMRELTGGYAPPAGACPTYRGLYHGLAQFERDMHVHVHLENNILFPRAAQRASERLASSRLG
jgi:regulator of cell morphogenesis and NO signaling